jgi:putative heme iron utilization protein
VAVDVLRPVDEQARALARRLLRSGVRAALASSEASTGWPYASLITVATALDGAPLLLVSGLSVHARALRAEPRCSLLFDTTGAGDPLAHPRLTVLGEARFLARDSEDGSHARSRFLARHPKAALYADFGDFSLVRVEPARAFLNAGFGRASELAAADFMTPVEGRLQPLQQSEAAAIAHMNADHADAVRLIATRLCGSADGAWELIGLDPDGIDLRLGDAVLRYVYAQPLADATELRPRLVALARLAREHDA